MCTSIGQADDITRLVLSEHRFKALNDYNLRSIEVRNLHILEAGNSKKNLHHLDLENNFEMLNQRECFFCSVCSFFLSFCEQPGKKINIQINNLQK